MRRRPRHLSRRTARTLAAGVLGIGLLLAAGACGGGGGDLPGDSVASSSAAPAPTSTTVDPAVTRYCDTVTRVQAEQTSPQAGQGGITAASDAARRQVADLSAAAPPELAGDWQTVQNLTDQALASLAAAAGDPNRIDRDALTRLEQQSQPAVEHIKEVTSARCHVAFRPPA